MKRQNIFLIGAALLCLLKVAVAQNLPPDIARVIADPAPTSMTQALARILPTYKRHFAAIKNSTSAQPSTSEEPRILMFHPVEHPNRYIPTPEQNRDIVFSITGAENAGPHGRDRIELMYWDVQQKRTRYGSLAPDEGHNGKKSYRYISGEQQCMACHPNGGLISDISPWEVDDVRKFVTDKCPNSSCDSEGHCGGPTTGSIGSEIYSQLDCQGFLANLEEDRRTLNRQFQERMKNIVRRRTIHFFKSNENFEKMKYAILGAMSACPDIEKNFLPSDRENKTIDPKAENRIAGLLKSIETRKEWLTSSWGIKHLEIEKQQDLALCAIGTVMSKYGQVDWETLISWMDTNDATMNCDQNLTSQIDDLVIDRPDLKKLMTSNGVRTAYLLKRIGCSNTRPLEAYKLKKIDQYCQKLASLSLEALKKD